MVLQLGSDHRQGRKCGRAFDCLEEFTQSAETQVGQSCILLQGKNLLYLFLGDGAAVIAYPEEKRCMVKTGRKCTGGCGLNEFWAGVIAMPDPQGENPRSIRPLPPE